MQSSDLDFVLPPELIAQVPAAQRSGSRLLHYQRANQAITHLQFSDLPTLLRAGDLLVFNDARVLPARFLLIKQTGGAVEGLFLSEPQLGIWRALLRNLGSAPAGTILRFSDHPFTAKLIARGQDGECDLAIDPPLSAQEMLATVGRMPLPPYIKRTRGHDDRDLADRERYQTVYAKTAGSVAAPTAGLHFSPQLLEELQARGIQRALLTLHVGMGTFKPVTADSLEDHRMHSESFSIDATTAEQLNQAEKQHRRIIAVGTTAARVLESWPADQPWQAADGETSIFIYPPYNWKRVSALITNFHLPRSTLIALVAALVDLPEQRRIYQEAIEQRYRFFSYGDAMFIE